MKPTHRFENHRFIIEDYDRQKPFSSFLPGLAGTHGVPLWSFYVNRGQGISSFGLKDKNGAILEFYPANLAYLYVSKIGFRTFIKTNQGVFESFLPENDIPKRRMEITQSEFSLIENNPNTGLETSVTYFGLPNESVAGLVRMVDIKNTSDHDIALEVLDGISQILPSGIDYGGYKAISNLLRSWMNVENLENNIAFYKLRSSTGDESEMKVSKDGNFYLSYVNNQIVRPIADMDLIYGYDTAMNHAANFMNHSLEDIENAHQVTENKVPCGFTPAKTRLKPGETLKIRTMIGYTHGIDTINRLSKTFGSEAYFDSKRFEAKDIIDQLLKDVYVKTAHPIFDEYIRQNYLDNLLRGGYPLTIDTDNKKFVYYLYSRKHGDLERDYNFFTIAPEYYSQGNGNFRDVCQNRRSDVLFHPEIADYNIQLFGSLIQADGYNPLSINGSTFEIHDKSVIKDLAKRVFNHDDGTMETHLMGKFTPGSIINTMAKVAITSKLSDDELFKEIMRHAKQNNEANFGEGYWVDHWTYILDLVENYLSIYPEKQTELLYNNQEYRYFDAPVSVYPRSEKYVIDKQGEIHQYGSLRHPDHEKIQRCGLKEHGTNWMKSTDGQFVETNLFSKLWVLAFNKFALLDPEGLGIEMEANKPGWNDAMNGLPGIFASGVSETIELARLVRFLKESPLSGQLSLPIEFVSLMHQIDKVSEKEAYNYWDKVATYRENYREAIRFGSQGSINVEAKTLAPLLDKMLLKLDSAINRIYDLGEGIVPTYLYYHVKKYELITDEHGNKVIGHYGLPLVKALQFELDRLPNFLEAPARYLKYSHDDTKNREMIAKIKKTGIYDDQLKMYKTSDNLDAYGFEIGRIRAFTKGWLEREANFLHMTYKYLLGILKSGNYDLFFEEAQDNLVCFMDPKVYGRSTLENSSFIATSNNPNPFLHGQGFVSRLSGSTAEMLSIFTLMFYGKKMFKSHQGELSLTLKPILTNTYFYNGKVSLTLFGQDLTYINLKNEDTYHLKPIRYTLKKQGQNPIIIEGDSVHGSEAHQIRNGEYDQIEVVLS
jgi:hypothetical protein